MSLALSFAYNLPYTKYEIYFATYNSTCRIDILLLDNFPPFY